MWKVLFTSIFFSALLVPFSLFAAPPSCPTTELVSQVQESMKSVDKVIQGAVSECLTARANVSESSVQSIYCPSGDMYGSTEQWITKQSLAYRVAVAAYLTELDKHAIQYAQSLQCLREKDPIKWYATNSIVLYGNGDDAPWYEQLYVKACNISYMLGMLNTPEKEWVSDSDTFPISECERLVSQKIQALDNLTKLIASKSIAKSYQNDKDIFVEGIKWKYKTLLEKASRYFRTVAQAVSKMNTYTKNPL